MCQSKTKRAARAMAAATAIGTMLAGCSDLYLGRSDSIALGAGDAIAANKIAQMYDPWPARSGNTNISFNGQRMQSAVERYRTNAVTPPVSPTTMVVSNPSPTTAQTGGAQNAAGGPAAGGSTTAVSAAGQ
jgi:hypothetical protein